MNEILDQYINIEVERLTNNIVNKAIHEKITEANYEDFFNVHEKENDSTKKISYDTTKINSLKAEITKYVQDVLIHLDDGQVEEYFIPNRVKSGRFQNIRSGILCDISIGSIRNSSLFANVGPTIPIKLIFTGQINSDIDVEVKEYGINNVMVEMYLVMSIHELVSMPLTSESKLITIREPISIDIIKGEIPNYYGGILK